MLYQRFSIQTKKRFELVNITENIKAALSESGIIEGMCTVYCPHTTAGITINEAADPAVIHDISHELQKIVPAHDGYTHFEGNSDAHIKATLTGPSQTIPVYDGQLSLGTWQGIFFCEYDGPRKRTVIVTILSET